MNISPLFRFPSTEHWITALLFLCVLLFTWVKTAYPKKVSLLFREVFTTYSFSENESGINPASIGMFVIFICSAVLLGLNLMHLYGVGLNRSMIQEFGAIALVLFTIYIGKTFIILSLGFIFDQQQRAWEYVSEIYVFAHFLGMVLLPAALLVTYAHELSSRTVLLVVFSAIGLLFVFRTIKMFILMTNKGLSMMYLFLYICALEILPFAVIVKYAKMSLGL